MRIKAKARTLFIVSTTLLSLSASGAVGPVYSYTFDDASSASQAQFSFGSGSTTYSIGWSPLNAGGGSPGSGSLALTLGLNTAVDNVSYGAIYVDIPGAAGQSFSSWSFDLQVDPASVQDTYFGYGYLEALALNPGFDAVYNEEMGNPTYAPTNLAGTWEHIDIALDPTTTGNNVSQLGFFLVGTPDRNLNGNVTFYVDNMVLVSVPEPSSGALILLGGTLPVLCRNRRLTRDGRRLRNFFRKVPRSLPPG
jgi:hypothetical protein